MPTSRLQFEDDMGKIYAELLAMAYRAAEDLGKAVEALRQRDAALAGYVVSDDLAINAMQMRVEDMAAVLIATQQPVARDLRELVSAIRLSDNLERMGDYAVHLAKTAIKLKDSEWPRQFGILGEMGGLGCRMIRDMAEAFMSRDQQAARDCAALDERMDELHHALVAMTLEGLKSRPGQAEEAIKIIRTSGFLERLGDHVTNACELVIYNESGRHEELN
jgi:phosphate transport system protein